MFLIKSYKINSFTIDEQTWKLVLPDRWHLSGEHEKAIR